MALVQPECVQGLAVVSDATLPTEYRAVRVLLTKVEKWEPQAARSSGTLSNVRFCRDLIS